MISFCVYHDKIKGHICPGCRTAHALFLAGVIEITVLVCGILALAEAGVLADLSQANAYILFSSGCLLFALDIIRVIIQSRRRISC